MYITKDITQRQGAYIKPKEKMEKKEILTSDFFKERERERERDIFCSINHQSHYYF